jgi:glycine oxidase
LIALHHGMGLKAEPLRPEDARELEPSLSPELEAAALRPDEASIDNRALTHAMLTAATNSGAEVFTGTSVTGIVKEGNRCTGLKLGNETVSAKWTVIAAGCFSAEITGVKEFAPVRPAKGQMVSLRADGLEIERVIWGEKVYIVPRNDGRILAGATVEYVGFDKQVTAGGIERILSSAIEVIPELAIARIEETWAGLRPDSPDHLPILGPTDIDGLMIATGHFRSGILLTPITARLIRQWITERSVEIDWDRLSPMRFIEARRETTA